MSGDKIQNLLSKYSFIIDPKSRDLDLSCIICGKLMNVAYQSHCECQYCRSCIIEYLLNGPKYCCGNKEDCKSECLVIDVNVSPNPRLNKRISRAKVLCPNENCMFCDELNKIEEHINVCRKKTIPCPYSHIGCNENTQTIDTMESHLHNSTLVHTQFLIDWIQDVSDNVHNSRINRTEIGGGNEINDILRQDCEWNKNRIVALEQESDNKEVQIKNMNDQIKNLQLENERKGTKDDNTLNEMMDQIKNLTDQIKIIKEEYDSLRETSRLMIELESWKNKSRIPLNQRARSVTRRQMEMMYRPDDSEQEICDIDIDSIDFKEMTFTIRNFSAQKEAMKDIFSPYFYSHTNGYKLRLRIHPNKKYSHGSFMMVSFIVCKGEYDDQLPWPFKYCFDISIINQRHKNISHSRKYDCLRNEHKSSAFEKPTDKDNNGFGYREYICSKDLESFIDPYDSILMKCTISAPQ